MMQAKMSLLIMAKKDLKAAKILATSNEPDMEIVGFHIQQAAEKALKAWLLIFKQPITKTHDLSFLLAQLEQLEQEVEHLWVLTELNPFAVQFRYGLCDDEPFQWEEAYQEVNQLIQAVDKITLE